MIAKEAPRPLRGNRDFLVLWSGQVVSVLGTRVSAIAYPLLVLAFTGSPWDAGLVGFAATAPYALLQLPAGVLVDRLDRRRVMIACECGRAIALASLAATAWLGWLTVAQVAAVAFVEGALFTVFGLAQGAALRRLVPAERLPEAIGYTEARTRGADMAGAPLGGLLFGLAHALPFALDAVSYVASIATVLLIRTPFQDRGRSEAPSRARKELVEGAAWFLRQPFLRTTTAMVAISNAIFQALELTVIVRARELGAGPAAIGLILGVTGIGGLAGSLVAPAIQRRLPAAALIAGVSWIWALLLGGFLLARAPLAMGALFATMSLLGAIWNVVVVARQLLLVPDGLLGRAQSVARLAGWGAIPLGSILAGIGLQSIGSRPTLVVLAAGMAAVAVWATWSRDVGRSQRGPAAPGGPGPGR